MANHWPGVTIPDAVWVVPALPSKQLPGRSGAGLVEGFSKGMTRMTGSKPVPIAVMRATPYFEAWKAVQIVLPYLVEPQVMGSAGPAGPFTGLPFESNCGS